MYLNKGSRQGKLETPGNFWKMAIYHKIETSSQLTAQDE